MNVFKKIFTFVGPTTRLNYWSHSRFMTWIRNKWGVHKPSAATWKEWGEWEESSKQQSPFVHWLTEDCIDKVQDIIFFPYDLACAVRRYVYNRFICQTHKLKSDLTPGQFYEFETKALHCLFTDLVDFVEIEKASVYVAGGGGSVFDVPWYNKSEITRLKPFRCPEAGIAYLLWEITLKSDGWDPILQRATFTDAPSQQALVAAEVLALYNWWKNERPKRKDPYELAGYNDYVLRNDDRNQLEDPFSLKPSDKSTELFRLALDIEERYNSEDDKMLMRLVKIRRSLWT